MTSIYSTGTVTVTNGSAAVVGTGTAWAVSLVTGGTLNIEAPGNPMPIAAVADDTHLTGAVKWTGASGTYSYAIVREDSDAANVVDLYDKLTRVLITLSLAGIHPNNSGSLAKRNALTLTADDDNYLFLRAELGVAFAFYRWDGPTLAWVGPFTVANAVASGGVSSLVGGTGIAVDATNPAVPVVSAVRPGTAKTTPVDADEVSLFDSAASFGLKNLTWANLKATVRSYLLGTASTWSAVQTFTGGVFGGSGASSGLSLVSTSGVGTADFIDFLVGNNGSIRAGRFDTSGNFLQGSTTAYTYAQEAGVGGTLPALQLHSGGTVGLGMTRWAANAVGGRAIFAKSRGGGVGTRGIVSNADSLGAFIFNGDDGTNFQAACFFGGYVDGTPGAGVMPGRIVFGTTPAGSSVPVERLRIDSAGMHTISGSLSRAAPVTKTADFTVAATENHLINNKSGSTCTVTLPAASSFSGREISIKNMQAQTVVSASSNVVPRASTSAGTAILASGAGNWATLVSDGTNWIIMAGS
ncbi:hypothetical protein [Mesorhizobium sp. B2-1-3A]|uniref:hypothetical protein n=1 Tax=Mesorhizobium sp. B2-1-3A TaxID=2589971 RepID=UPI00112EB4AE|nr:hypothetical protein [Mesorhizobium sp. B2-1-3A]TPM92737.1 hypothetical protein FJ977_28055 [Mesorhizobium sp. B2-1-3A]